jgi:hypothetical protein
LVKAFISGSWVGVCGGDDSRFGLSRPPRIRHPT